MSDDLITLNPCQSLALRRLVEAFKANDSLYSACPDVVRSCFCDFYMPPYSDAESMIKAIQEESAHRMRVIDKFGQRIYDLESKLYGTPRKLIPPPY